MRSCAARAAACPLGLGVFWEVRSLSVGRFASAPAELLDLSRPASDARPPRVFVRPVFCPFLITLHVRFLPRLRLLRCSRPEQGRALVLRLPELRRLFVGFRLSRCGLGVGPGRVQMVTVRDERFRLRFLSFGEGWALLAVARVGLELGWARRHVTSASARRPDPGFSRGLGKNMRDIKSPCNMRRLIRLFLKLFWSFMGVKGLRDGLASSKSSVTMTAECQLPLSSPLAVPSFALDSGLRFLGRSCRGRVVRQVGGVWTKNEAKQKILREKETEAKGSCQ